MHDLTGADPEFAVNDRRFTVYKHPQIMELGEPAFADPATFKVYHVGTGGTTELTIGVDYVIRDPDDEDVAAISYAKTQEPTFNYNLIKSFVMLRWDAGEGQYQISVDYQQFYHNDYGYTPHATTGPEYTPQLMQDMINDLEYVKELYNPVEDMTADLLSGIVARDIDLTGLNPDNFVENELHEVDVPNNKKVIFPAAGSFYKHDLHLEEVVDGVPNIVLAEGTGYVIIGAN
jgi:hypothetical protein